MQFFFVDPYAATTAIFKIQLILPSSENNLSPNCEEVTVEMVSVILDKDLHHHTHPAFTFNSHLIHGTLQSPSSKSHPHK